MTDAEIEEAIGRRLAEVEHRLPPVRVAPAGSRGRLVIGAGAATRPVSTALVVVAVVIGAYLALVGRSPERQSGIGALAASASPTSAATASPLPSTEPGDASTTPGLRILRGNVEGDLLISRELGWGSCGVRGDVVILLPDVAEIDQAIDARGIVNGWVDVGRFRYWVAPSAEQAAAGYGSPILAVGPRDTWIVQGDHARQLVPHTTPKGRTFWLLTGSAGPCGWSAAPG